MAQESTWGHIPYFLFTCYMSELDNVIVATFAVDTAAMTIVLLLGETTSMLQDTSDRDS